MVDLDEALVILQNKARRSIIERLVQDVPHVAYQNLTLPITTRKTDWNFTTSGDETPGCP